MSRYFVRLAYRGTHYRGWQRQPKGVPTVQATIERALTQVQTKPTKVVGCGRTDAGVHASEYFLHFDTEGELRDKWLFIMNKRLPEDIVFYEVWPVESTGHSRYGATARSYQYNIHCRPDPLAAVTSCEYPLHEYDLEEMRQAADHLRGRHDFRSFCLTPDRHNTTTCDLREATLEQLDPDHFRFTFTADRFLRGMIRIIVYQLLGVGRGELGAGEIKEVLAGTRELRVGQARPEGLILSSVRYGESFENKEPVH